MSMSTQQNETLYRETSTRAIRHQETQSGSDGTSGGFSAQNSYNWMHLWPVLHDVEQI